MLGVGEPKNSRRGEHTVNYFPHLERDDVGRRVKKRFPNKNKSKKGEQQTQEGTFWKIEMMCASVAQAFA